MTAILGISAFYHDAAAALVVDGEIVAAAQEERFSRVKHDDRFPNRAIEFCLERAGLKPEDLDLVGFYDKPLLKFERLLESYLAHAPAGFPSFLKAMPLWLHQKLHLPREMDQGLGGHYNKRYLFTRHHEAHAASAFFPSPFDEAAILTLDGVGEWATASRGTGRGNRLTLTHEQNFPHSLGLLYTAFTYYLGFKVNDGEYKVMGLAPYGEPTFVDQILKQLIDLKDDGSFRMDMDYFGYGAGLKMTTPKFDALFGGPARRSDQPLEQRHMDVAASIQRVTEEIMLRSVRHLHRETGLKNLCLAGGVALNCVGNGRILRETDFENVWVQPAAGDAGGALGTALFAWFQLMDNPRQGRPDDLMRGALLGPAFDDQQIAAALDGAGAVYSTVPDEQALCAQVAEMIDQGKAVGWFQGAMEFGPRVLGARSILGDARSPRMQSLINNKVKFREGFRPFAPSVLREEAAGWFEVPENLDSPYMTLIAPVREGRRRPISPEDAARRGIDKLQVVRSEIPAVTHVDNSARLQTVDGSRHGLYHRLLQAFHQRTGCPVLINTSFNLGWEPIVCTPADAYRTFMASGLDALCIGHHLLLKERQKSWVSVEQFHDPAGMLTEVWASPCHQAEIKVDGDGYACAECGHRFSREGDIPLLFYPHPGFCDGGDATEKVKSFYERNPFPNYDDHDSVASLIEKSHKGMYARMLDETIPHNARVLEVGCGTGQLSNYLGIGCRRAYGGDLCLNSLRLANGFRERSGLKQVRFSQINLFMPPFRDEAFDVVICQGVLMATSDPFGGFRRITRLVKPGGHIVIGLYNTYGRLATDFRRWLFRMTGGRALWLDPYLRSRHMSKEKIAAWYADQYHHPQECKHSTDELLGWFRQCGIEYVRGIPPITLGEEPPGLGAELFEPKPVGTRLEHLLTQFKQIYTGSFEGGFFIIVGRKPDAPAAARRPAETRILEGQGVR